MSTIQIITGPTSVKGSESWYSDQDTRWTTGYFAYVVTPEAIVPLQLSSTRKDTIERET